MTTPGGRSTLALSLSLAALGLTGCASQNDNHAEGFTVVNEGDVAITVHLVAAQVPQPEPARGDQPVRPHEFTVEPGDSAVLVTDRCLEADILLTSRAGDVADVEGPACPGSVLRVQDDGTAVIEMMFG